MQRRQFILASAATSVGALLARPAWTLPPNDPVMEQLGIQLYTVRSQLEMDVPGTIQTVAKAGYQQVELMEIMGAESLIATAREEGLEVTSSFFNWKTIAMPDQSDAPTMDAVIEAAEAAGLKYLVFGYIGKEARETLDDYRRIADAANAAAEKVQQAGMTMCYHNHAFEFEPLDGDTMGFDIFVDRFDAEQLPFELDVFWVAIGGWNPVQIMEKLSGRIAQLHLKDIKPGTGTIYDEARVPMTAFQEIGDGLIDFRKVVGLAHEQGIKQFHVEQDQSPDPLESIAISQTYLSQMDL